MELDAATSALNALSAVPWWSFAGALLALFGWMFYRYHLAKMEQVSQDKAASEVRWREKEKNARAEKFTASLNALSTVIQESNAKTQDAINKTEMALSKVNSALGNVSSSNDAFVDTQLRLSGAVESLVESQGETADALKALVAISGGAMSADDTRRLVHRELESLRKEVTLAFKSSLRKNHYNEDPVRVETNLKRGLRVQFDNLVKILGGYRLAVSPLEFVETATSHDGRVYYPLIDRLWNEVLPLYLQCADYTNRTVSDAQDKTTSSIVKQIFSDEYEVRVRGTLSRYTRDPGTGGYPATRERSDGDSDSHEPGVGSGLFHAL